MKNYFAKILVLLLLAVIVQNCVPSKPNYEERVLTSDRLIKKLEANRRQIKTFKGTGVIKVNTPQVDAKANFEVMIKKPDSIKISIFGPFGIDLAEALVTKNEYIFFDIMKNNVYRGSVSQDVLKRIFKVNLTFDELTNAFAGAVNLTDKLSSEPDDYNILDDSYILTYRDTINFKESVYKINIDDLAITDYNILTLNNDLLLAGRYSDFRKYEDVPVPFQTKVENVDDNQSIDIEYRRVNVNDELKDLKINIPEDANVIQWD